MKCRNKAIISLLLKFSHYNLKIQIYHNFQIRQLIVCMFNWLCPRQTEDLGTVSVRDISISRVGVVRLVGDGMQLLGIGMSITDIDVDMAHLTY